MAINFYVNSLYGMKLYVCAAKQIAKDNDYDNNELDVAGSCREIKGDT